MAARVSKGVSARQTAMTQLRRWHVKVRYICKLLQGKHDRGTSKADYSPFVSKTDNDYIKSKFLYSNRSPQTDRSSLIYSNSNLGLYYYIFATRALYSSGTISSSAIYILLACLIEVLAGLGVLLICALFASAGTALLCFRPYLAVPAVSSSVASSSIVSSSALSVLLFRFRPRFPLPLAA